MTTEQMSQELEQEQATQVEEPERYEPEPLEVDIGGGVKVAITPEELGPYVRFKKWADSHPDLWNGFVGVEAGTHELRQRGQTPEPIPQTPEEPDFEDPSKMRELYDRVSQHEQMLQRDAAMRSQDAVTQGATRFRSRHEELSKEELDRVMTTAAELELVIPLSKRLPQADAVDQALELAYRNIAWESRGDQVARETVNNMTSRKRAVSAVGASKASAPRTPPTPQTDAERREAMVQEIAQAMGEQSG